LQAEICRRSLKDFIRTAWPIVEPSPLVWGWHIDALAEHLAAITAGQLKRLLITIPPRHGKSLIVGVLWPCWEWASRPNGRWLFASYAESLAIRDNVKARRLIQSAWYQRNWAHVFQFAGDQNEKRKVETDRGGHRIAVGTGGSATGEGGDRLVIDDAHNVREIESDDVRKGVLDWHDQVWSTRANDPRNTARIIVGQRVHEDDLAGHVLEQGGWEHLSLSAEFEGDNRATAIGWSDPRTEMGQLLWPEQFGPAEVAAAKRVLGSYAYSAQYQQRPSPTGGGIFKRWWWRYWKPKGMDLQPVTVRLADGSLQQIHAVDLPNEFDEVIESFDMAFKDLATSDYVAGGVWATKKADRFLLDQVRERLSFPRTLEAVKALSAKWPMAHRKLVEDKANGTAVLATLQHDISGLIAVNPAGGKVARAQAVSPQVESGNVYLPHPALAPWVDAFIEECSAFPNGKHDDQVDQMTQALNRLTSSLQYGLTTYLQELQAEITGRRIEATAVRLEAGAQTDAVSEGGKQPTKGCPNCGATCIQNVATGGKRCGACGTQFDLPALNFKPVSRAGLFK
jgi:predicted phage terminase large subunit-like protein